jgi:hypothetical protein
MEHAMGFGRAFAVLACLMACVASAQARPFTIEEVESVGSYGVDRIKPSVIVFSDGSHTRDVSINPAPGLVQFDAWARIWPDEKRLLSLQPDYTEPSVSKMIGGVRRQVIEKLAVYIAEARFTLDRTLTEQDINRYATLSFVEHIDPAVKHRLITPAEVAPLVNPKAAHNRNPARPWCVGGVVICLRSHYRLEGKLPLGVQLANKVRDSNRKIADYLEFESELAVRTPAALDQDGLKRLTRLNTPIVATLEQSTFYINQVLQFGKSILVFQQHPSDQGKTVVTAFIAIAIESKLLDTKKEYAKVPVLRNLVPVQVLMGKSSFNSGSSISSGLPNYARSRIRAIADILDNK